MNKITPFLWFNDNAAEAAEFYVSVFPNSKMLSQVTPTNTGPGGTVQVVEFEIDGQQVTLMGAKGGSALNEAFSFTVRCEDQKEIDQYWETLLDGGSSMACGWLKDKFGVCWQIVPKNMGELLKRPGAMQAMMGMVKLDIAGLEGA
jgi:predicted 3-demethylubiquinone-9 3-methyltransferase (glyoxalase superfamily)